jgi:sulfite exporter TauE/SafE
MSLILTIILASLLGSLHCAGMCGAFVAMACQGGRPWAMQCAYHGGRLMTYVAMGAIAGGLGAMLDLGSSLAGFEPVALTLASTLMIGWGLVVLLGAFGFKLPLPKSPGGMQRLLMEGHRATLRFGPSLRALSIGLLTTLLPCGWLYLFVARAAGEASVGRGAIVMLAFWIGTVPILSAMGFGTRTLTKRLGRKLPIATASIILVAGLWTLMSRHMLDGRAMAAGIEVVPAAAPVDAVPSCCAREKSERAEEAVR